METVAIHCTSITKAVENNYISPTISLEFVWNGLVKTLKCKIDTASCRSYITTEAAKYLFPEFKNFSSVEFDIETVIGNIVKSLKQTLFGVKLTKRIVQMPFLIDSSLQIDYELPGLSYIIDNILDKNIELADKFHYENKIRNNIPIDVLIGIGILQFFPEMKFTSLFDGRCLVIDDKIIPIGNVNHFLNKNQK